VKLIAQVRVLPDASQAAALQATLNLANQAAILVSGVAWEQRCFGNYQLRRHTYGQLKAMGLSAQPAQHVIKKVADAYRTVKAQVRDGLRGPLTGPVAFRADAAQPYDDRCLSWQLDRGTLSIWATAGRLKGVRFTCGDHQRRLLAYR
jgi:putative transposase